MKDTTLPAPGHVAVENRPVAQMYPMQADSDEQLVELWLHNLAANTAKAYTRDLARFQAFTGGKRIRQVTVGDLNGFCDRLGHLAPASRARTVGTIKSLLTFALDIGYLAFNPGRAVRTPKVTSSRAARIMSELEVEKLIDAAQPGRDKTLLLVLYGAALRISEALSMRVRDVIEREDGGQIDVLGKGDKRRQVRVYGRAWEALRAFCEGAGQDDYVFRTCTGKRVDGGATWRMIRATAQRAGVDKPISAHWFRHGHASHALDRGAPVHLVSQTLGHASLATTTVYVHARPGEGSGRYLGLT